jgi:hypothetical protein
MTLLANYLCGVDLGQSSDYTAVAIVEHLEEFTDRRPQQWVDMHGFHSAPDIENLFHVLDLRRWRSTPYPVLVEEICKILKTPQLRGRVSLTYDRSGLGAAVGDLFDAARRHGELEQYALGVTITSGGESRAGQVSKKNLISRLVVALESGRVKIADSLPLAATLKAELLEFRARINAAAHTSYEAPSGKHDDLVLALALAMHWVRRTGLPNQIDREGRVSQRDHDRVAL